MKKLLITGFDPFDGQTVNPSWEAVKLLPDTIGEYKLCKLPIPTRYTAAPQIVLQKAAEFRPDVILSVGLAGGRDAVTPERIAVNIRDARIPDNGGVLHSGERIAPDGPAAYFSTVPVEAMAEAVRSLRLPASVSNTAGTYVCNDVLYSLLHHFHSSSTRVGFIHVPYLPEQGAPNLPLTDIVRALESCIRVL